MGIFEKLFGKKKGSEVKTDKFEGKVYEQKKAATKKKKKKKTYKFEGKVYESYCSPQLRLKALKQEVNNASYGFQRAMALDQLVKAIDRGLVDKSTAAKIAIPVLKNDRDSGARDAAAEILVKSIDAKGALKCLVDALENEYSPNVKNIIITGLSDTWRNYRFEKDIALSVANAALSSEEDDSSLEIAVSLLRKILKSSSSRGFIRQEVSEALGEELIQKIDSSTPIEDVITNFRSFASEKTKGAKAEKIESIMQELGPLPEPEKREYVAEIVSLIERVDKIYELSKYYNLEIEKESELVNARQHCENRLVEIGKKLNKSGGIDLMSKTYQQAYSSGGFKGRYLDHVWNRIGKWMG